MLNFIFYHFSLFLLTGGTFFILLTVRFVLQRKISIFLYHLGLFGVLFVLSLGGGGVLNDGYKRLEEFVALEKSNKLEYARKHLEEYDSMLRIDLKAFKDSAEFNAYLKTHEAMVDKVEAMFVGWFFVFLAELSMVLLQALRYLVRKIQGD